jgi:hypothetical protein
LHGWFEDQAPRHAKELLEEAERHRLARALKEAGRDGRRAGRRFGRGLAVRIVDFAREAFPGKGVLEQPACEECLSK